jgi:hypothetical protein
MNEPAERLPCRRCPNERRTRAGGDGLLLPPAPARRRATKTDAIPSPILGVIVNAGRRARGDARHRAPLLAPHPLPHTLAHHARHPTRHLRPRLRSSPLKKNPPKKETRKKNESPLQSISVRRLHLHVRHHTAAQSSRPPHSPRRLPTKPKKETVQKRVSTPLQSAEKHGPHSRAPSPPQKPPPHSKGNRQREDREKHAQLSAPNTSSTLWRHSPPLVPFPCCKVMRRRMSSGVRVNCWVGQFFVNIGIKGRGERRMGNGEKRRRRDKVKIK